MTVTDPFLIAANLFDPVPDPYFNDPVLWASEIIDWEDTPGLNAYQQAELRDLVAHGRLAVRGPHGIGKTTVDALAVLWFATTREKAGRDWKVITTADAWRQLEQYLWPEIHKWAKRIRWDKLDMRPWNKWELLDLHIKLSHGEAMAVASNDPARIEGAHADSLLYIIDEAKIVPPGTWDAIEGAFMNEGAPGTETFLLANSTPGEPNGRFYDIHRRKAGYEDWKPFHVTLAMAIEAGRINPDVAERRKRQWGIDSAQYQNRVLGEFAASDENAVVPLAWVEAANERWLQLQAEGRIDEGVFKCCGVDVAWTGADQTVIALRNKPVKLGKQLVSVITRLIRHSKQDPTQTTDEVELYVMGAGTWAIIDVIGMGAGVVSNLRHRNRGVVAFNASERTERRDRSGELGFVNKRSAAWWNIRELLDPESLDPVALPPDDLLTGDLCAPTWRRVAGGRIQVESKEDIAKRIGRSTDTGDAVIQAFWDEAPLVLDSGWTNGNGNSKHKTLTGDLLTARF